MSARLLVIEPDVLKESKIEAMLANYHAKSVIFCVSYLKLTVDLEELNPDVVLISYNCGCLVQDVISAVREKSYAAIIVLAPELCADEKALILNAGADALINMEKVTKDYLVALIRRFFIRVEQVKFVESFINNVHQGWKLSREKWVLISPSGRTVNLTATEFTLIDVLLNYSPNPVSREVLAESLGRDACENYEGHINTIISRLRKKVREQTEENIDIKSYRAKGYSLFSKISYLI